MKQQSKYTLVSLKQGELVDYERAIKIVMNECGVSRKIAKAGLLEESLKEWARARQLQYLQARREYIYFLHTDRRESLASIGRRFGICRERAREIFHYQARKVNPNPWYWSNLKRAKP